MPSPAEPAFPPDGFQRFWAGEAVSSFGTYVTLLALQTIVVLTLQGTAQDVGWLNSARWLPYLVLGLIVGALVDRRPRRPVMIATDLIRAVLLAAIPAAWAWGLLTLPLLLLIVVGYGTASLTNDAASMSFLPRLVPRQHLQRAHARLDGADAVAQTTGPVLAGVLIKLVGAPFAVLADALSYVFSAAMVLTMRTPEPIPAPGRSRSSLRQEMLDGCRWVYGASGLATLAIATHVWFAANAIVGTVVAPLALTALKLSPLQFGVAIAVGGVGAVAGAACSTPLGRRLGTGWAVIAAFGISTIGVAVMAVAGLGTAGWASVVVLGVGQLCFGFGLTFSNSHEMSFRQTLTPDELQARTNTTMRAANRAVVVVVAPLGGLLAVQAGLRPALLVAVGIFVVAALILVASPFRTVDLTGPPHH